MKTPLTPISIAGILMRPLPNRHLLQPLVKTLAQIINKKHPGLVRRLSCLGETKILFDPIDLPINFLSTIRPEKIDICITENTYDIRNFNAVIRGTITNLYKLTEGTVDGDALFFSRELIVEGDTEVTVALRNALEAENINIVDDVLKYLGPFSRPAHFFVSRINGLFTEINNDFEKVINSLLQPIYQHQKKQAVELKYLNEQVDSLNNQMIKMKSSLKKLKVASKMRESINE